jgi:hypothetical protein
VGNYYKSLKEIKKKMPKQVIKEKETDASILTKSKSIKKGKK